MSSPPETTQYEPTQQQRLATILNRMRELGLETIESHYDGSCDSGAVDDIFGFYTRNPKADEQLPKELQDEVEDYTCISLCNHFGIGWGDGDGSYGTLIFNLKDKTVDASHYWRTTSDDGFSESLATDPDSTSSITSTAN